MAKKKPTAPTKVESLRHQDKRKNIPTEELRDFVAEEELAPKPRLYPRDPSLDPQLVWKGKDEQDAADLSVPIVPIYIQEKIHPQAIVDALPRIEKAGDGQLDLFADFNGLPPEFEQRVDFYHHDGHWSNRMILGDSLLVMTSLAEKEGLKGKVQTIYLDPPYGIKFGSNWQVSTRKRDVKDGKSEDATRQPEQIRAFRDTWQLGIHSYLAYLRDRLTVARELLTETGSVFVQIGIENVHLVRSILDEVFGSENAVEMIAFRTKNMTLGGTLLEGVCDYLLWFAKDKEAVKYRKIFEFTDAAGDSHWNRVILPNGQRRTMTAEEISDHSKLPTGSEVYQLMFLSPAGSFDTGLYEFSFQGKTYSPPPGRSWKTPITGMERLAWAERIEPYAGGQTLRYVLKLGDYPVSPIHNLWSETPPPSDKVYAVQTSNRVIERCLLMTTDPGDLVLDPTCGSGTTAYIAEQWGRRWITCDTSRVALALARTRLMAAKYPYYLLADSPEGRKKEAEITGTLTSPRRVSDPALSQGERENSGDIKKGFVYKRVPHVTLKSIANNPDIREGMTRQQIDAAIAKHAETETLFDQPYEDNKRIRVTGPFTVESLSPHRTISAEEKKLRSEVGKSGLRMKVVGPDNFGHMILENLRKAGVQNTRKGERLNFETLEPYAGEWIHGQGTITERNDPQITQIAQMKADSEKENSSRQSVKSAKSADNSSGVVRRVAVCIGPEHGTVGATLIKEAAKEAVKGVGFDVLVVCGFAFDPSVSEEAKRYGKLVVLPTKMNPDLAMGDELLKKTGAGNLFMVFGEPDVEIKKKNGHITVEIKGLDVYDPTTGQIRNSSTDDIACWFIDTDYNGESFFVRHAYFTGADEPYDRLKRALRAEIDEAAWSSLYSTVSRPFEKPSSGKIAVKVINHYGDEILKVFGV